MYCSKKVFKAIKKPRLCGDQYTHIPAVSGGEEAVHYYISYRYYTVFSMLFQ